MLTYWCGLGVARARIVKKREFGDVMLIDVTQPLSIPPLPEAVRRLQNLSELERSDPRVLGLIANTDPVFMARLLAAANAAHYGRSIATDVFEAVKRIGTVAAYDWLLAVAAVSVWALPEKAVRYRNALTMRSVRVTAGLRRKARARGRDERMAGLLGIFESMGLYALLANATPQQEEVFDEVLGPRAVVGPSAEGRLCGYHFVSCRVCLDWSVPSDVTNALHPLKPNSYSYLLEETLLEVDLPNASANPA